MPSESALRRPIIIEIDLEYDDDDETEDEDFTKSPSLTHVSCSEEDPEPIIKIKREPFLPKPLPKEQEIIQISSKETTPNVSIPGDLSPQPNFQVEGYEVSDASSQVLLASVPSISTLMTSCMGSPPTVTKKAEPIREEPIREEPLREEPIREEPVREESIREKPLGEKLIREEPIREEPVKEEPVREELTREEAVKNVLPQPKVGGRRYKIPKQGLLASLCQQTNPAKVRVGLSKRLKIEPLHDNIRRK